MPRPLRLEYPNAWYHVMNRGAARQKIFRSSKQRELFLDLLLESTQYFQIEVHAYCLMDNHYHLLIKTPHGNLSRAMRHINGVYTQRYNRLEKTDGALFRGRYKAILVDKNSYLLQVSRYIHRNPIELKLPYPLIKYPWSSYKSYIETKTGQNWLKTDEILQMVGKKKPKENYRIYVESGLDEETSEFYNKKNLSVIFGGTEFKTNLLNGLKSEQKKVSFPDYNHTKDFPSLDVIALACSRYFDISNDELSIARRGSLNEPRKIAMYACRAWSNEKLAKIAKMFHCNAHSSVSNSVIEIKHRLEHELKLRKILKEIKMKL